MNLGDGELDRSADCFPALLLLIAASTRGVLTPLSAASIANAFRHIPDKLEYDRLEIERFMRKHGIKDFGYSPFFPAHTWCDRSAHARCVRASLLHSDKPPGSVRGCSPSLRFAKYRMPHCASLTAQFQLLHCHAHDTVRAAPRRKLFVGKL